MLTIYGIKNCDTMKKAFVWLDEHHIAYQFHDYKKSGLNETVLQPWLAAYGWQALVNQKGSTWRKLALDKDTLSNDSALPLILAHLSLLKRPILKLATDQLLIGFHVDTWQKHLLPTHPFN